MTTYNCLIKNLREDGESRLIKFRKVGNATFNVPLEIPAIATVADGFNVCLAPYTEPDLCKNATNLIGLRFDNFSLGTTWSLKNKKTDSIVASGTVSQEYENMATEAVVDVINSIDGLESYTSNGYGNPFVIQNISSEDISLVLSIASPNDNFPTINEYTSQMNNILPNPSLVVKSEQEFEFCLIASLCSVSPSTLPLKAVGDLTGKQVVYNLELSYNDRPSLSEVKVLGYDIFHPNPYVTHNQDYSRDVCQSLSEQLSEFVQVSFDLGGFDQTITPYNNCINNIGDCEFELRINGSQTITNTVELVLTEDNGSTYIRVQSPPSGNNRDTILTNLASQLASHGYTVVTPASNSKIRLRKNAVSSLRVVTNGYGIYSFSVNSSDWGYDGTLIVDGVHRENVGVRPFSCTLGVKDPYRNFATTVLQFKSWPLKDPNIVNYVKGTITPVTELGPNQVDFLTTFTNVNSFVFESCDTNISPSE